MLGDFNALVGGADMEDWAPLLGDHQLCGDLNFSGRHLLAMCQTLNLAVTSTFFEPGALGAGTHRQPDQPGRFERTIDYILVPVGRIPDVIQCAVDGTICDSMSDHRLIVMEIRAQQQERGGTVAKKRQDQVMMKKRYEISALKDAGVKEKMNSVLKGKFTEMHKRREEAVASGVVLERMYDEFEKLVQEALQETIPIDREKIQTKRKTNWFAEYEEILVPLIEEKRNCYMAWQRGIQTREVE